jgi:hypothetical protein
MLEYETYYLIRDQGLVRNPLKTWFENVRMAGSGPVVVNASIFCAVLESHR